MAGFSNLQLIQLQKSSGNVYEAMNNIAKGSVNHNNQGDLTAYLNQLIANRSGLRGGIADFLPTNSFTTSDIQSIVKVGSVSSFEPTAQDYAKLKELQGKGVNTTIDQVVVQRIQKASAPPLQENKIVSYEPPTLLQEDLYQEDYGRRTPNSYAAPTTYAAPPPAQKVQTIAPPVREVAPLPPPPVVAVKEKVPTWVWYAGGGAAALILVVLITSK